MLTAAAPVFRNVGNFKNVTAVASKQERYIGVVGIDVAVADIFQDLVDSSRHGKRSFAFLVDFKGRALYHPSLPSPEQNTGNQPQFVDIRELLMIQNCSGGISSSWSASEGVDTALVESIRASMTSGGSGSQHLRVTMMYPRGSPPRARTRHILWDIVLEKIDNADFSLGFFYEDEDSTRYIIPPESVTHNETKEVLKKILITIIVLMLSRLQERILRMDSRTAMAFIPKLTYRLRKVAGSLAHMHFIILTIIFRKGMKTEAKPLDDRVRRVKKLNRLMNSRRYEIGGRF